jgi:hypothetical protein
VKESRGTWRRVGAAIVAIAVTAAVHSAMDTSAAIDGDRMRVPNPESVRLASVGFDAVISDYYWLQALQLVGGDRGDSSQKAETIAELIDVVTTLDPWVGHPYRFAAVWLTDSERNVRRANHLLERGIAHAPLDWRNRYHLGFNHFYYLGENLRAADIFEEALPLPGVPRYLGPLVARLRLNLGGLEMAGQFLAELADSTSDEFSRAEYLKALDEISTERFARILDTAREEYRRRHGRDISAVSELVAGPDPILRRLPPAHPHFEWPDWEIDESSGRIVSSFYGSRYRLHMTKRDEERHERWRKARSQDPKVS